MWAEASRETVDEPAEIAWRGIELCRSGEWQEGLYWLSLAAESDARSAELPGLLFSYLGYGLARHEQRTEEGLRLLKLGMEVELHQPESYFLLADFYLFQGDRRAAIPVLERGLLVDPTHQGLEELKRSLGRRRPPVVPFLPRRHALNRWAGKLRHRLLEFLNN